MRNVSYAAVLVTALMTSACTSSRMSYVTPDLAPADAVVLARSTADFVTSRLSTPATIILKATEASVGNDALTPALQSRLGANGYDVEGGDRKTTGRTGHSLRYLATPLDGGQVLRLELDNITASRYFERTREGLTPASAFMVRESAE